MVGKQASSLLSLPTEIIQSILTYFLSRDLSQKVEMTCKELQKLMIPVYRIKYGYETAPSVSVTSSCWKRFAIQHEAHRSDIDQIRDGAIDNILEIYFDSPDHTLLKDAEDVIYYLHDNPHTIQGALRHFLWLGEVGQTPAEIALCNGHNIPFIGSSSLPRELFATKQYMAKAIIGGYCAAMFKKQQKCSGFNRALNDAESKPADIWTKKIGLKTLQGLIDMIGTPLFKSVKKLLGIITGFDMMPVELREEQFQDVDDIKNI